MNRASTFPHRWVMHMWSNGDVTPWHTRNDHEFTARYGGDIATTRERRECSAEELADIEREYAQWGAL